MKKKIYYCLLIIIGFLTYTGCEKEQVIRVEPELSGLSFSILNSTEIVNNIPKINDKGEELYSAYMNQKVLMIIDIANPEDYEITSLFINEIEIENFESISTNSTIIYQVDTSERGLKEFIVNKINYKFNDEIYSVNLDENNKVFLDVIINIKANVAISNRYFTSTSFSFDVEINNNNHYINQDEILFKAVLFDGVTTVQEVIIYDNDMTVNFPNLERNKLYRFEVVAIFSNTEFLLYTEAFQTFDQIYINNVSSTEDTISFDIYKNSNINISKIELYEGATLIDTLTDLSVMYFSNLNKSTKYTIKIIYEINLDDKVIESSYTYEYSTLAASIELTEMIVNRDTIKIGESITVHLTVNNPDNVILKAVVITGVRVEVKNGNYISITYAPKSVVGILNVKVEKFIYEINGIEVTQKNNSYLNHILNIYHIEILEIYNENNNIVVEGVANDLIIKLDNPNDYIIKELYFKYDKEYLSYKEDEITILDKNHVKVAWKGRTNFEEKDLFQEVELYMISCASNDEYFYYYYNTIYSRYKIKNTFTILNSYEIKEINNIEELMNIESGYKYKLMRDLDLTGLLWDPLYFSGFLDGNNHSINNLRIVSNYPEEDVNVGLFKEYYGVLENLNIKGANIIVRAKAATVGGLVGQGSFSIENCTFEGSIDVGSERAFIGGLIGKGENSNIFYNTINAIIKAEGNNQSNNMTGGIAGYSLNTNFSYNITNSNIDLKKYSTYKVGGIVGSSNGVDTITISNNIVGDSIINVDKELLYGLVSSLGGIAGYAGASEINNNLILCTLNYTGWYIYYGGIVGDMNNSRVFDNLLAKKNISIINDKDQSHNIDIFVGDKFLSSKTYNNFITYDKNYLVYTKSNEYYLQKSNVNLVDYNKLNLSSFYIDELNWDRNVWNFESLDYLKGIYPTLKGKDEVK